MKLINLILGLTKFLCECDTLQKSTVISNKKIIGAIACKKTYKLENMRDAS